MKNNDYEDDYLQDESTKVFLKRFDRFFNILFIALMLIVIALAFAGSYMIL